MFLIKNQSVFKENPDSYVWTANCKGICGAGIALEFKQKFPDAFEDYKKFCIDGKLKPGDCHIFKQKNFWLLGLAVKNDWKYWSCTEWMYASLKSLKLVILENDIKSVNMPLVGAMNGRRGPNGKIPGMTPPPENKQEIQILIQNELESFANKFNIQINLCIPEEIQKKPTFDLTQFLEK